MPSTFVPIPQFPTVYPFPGVPPLLTSALGPAITLPVLAAADSVGLGSWFGVSQWGIYAQDGTPLLVAAVTVDSVNSFEYTRDYKVSDYPQEQGAFQSYNKVQVPYQSKVTFVAAGTRTTLLNIMEPIAASLALVVIVTPEISYPSANITHYGIRPRQSTSGPAMVYVDVWFEEIRVTAGVALSTQSAAIPASTPGTSTTAAGAAAVGAVTGGATSAAGLPTPVAVTPSEFLAPIQTQTNLPNATSTNAASPQSDGAVQTQAPQGPWVVDLTPH